MKDTIAEKAEKLRVDLVPPEAVEGIARALQFGAKKHGDRMWEKDPMDHHLPIAALKRHLLAYEKGETIDPEMQISHWDAILANAAIMRTYIARGLGRDCRVWFQLDSHLMLNSTPTPIKTTAGDK